MHDASVRMTSHLNALARHLLSPEVAAHAIAGPDAAHHVTDPDDLLGLDPLHALDLDLALPVIAARERTGWLLALPVPGGLGPLRGPRDLNEAALASGEVVLGTTAELALVPHQVGPAVQWRVHRAAAPFPSTGSGEAERELNQTLLTAAAALTELDVPAAVSPGSGRRPDRTLLRADTDPSAHLAPGYPQRRQVAAHRAASLLEVCEVALADDGGAISSYEADARRRQLIALRTAARAALAAAVSWTGSEPQSN